METSSSDGAVVGVGVSGMEVCVAVGGTVVSVGGMEVATPVGTGGGASGVCVDGLQPVVTINESVINRLVSKKVILWFIF
jgi:hypothetical protein